MTQEQSKKLISLFYAHLLHVDELCPDPEEKHSAMVNLCLSIFDELKSYTVQEIIDIIKENFVEHPISSADITQFSDFDDAVYNAPYLTIASRESDIGFIQMGYMLLKSPKKDEAYIKYGENHAKTAAQIGLCYVQRGKINPSYLGVSFFSLYKEEQKELMPKLLLYIPLIQNFYALNRDTERLQSYFSLLSESTQARRRSNVKTLINCVGKYIDYEL